MKAEVSAIGVDALEYDPESGTVRTLFDPEQIPTSTAVIATLAEVMDADPVELDPLYATVEPDALDAIVRVRTGTTGDLKVSFTHEDHAITVSSYGVITITSAEEPLAANSGRWAGR